MTILLKNLLAECRVTNTINLMRVDTVLENTAPKLSEADQKKLAEVYVELKALVEVMNTTPYTTFNVEKWNLLKAILIGKVAEFKLVAEDIAEDNKDVDCWPLANAIDTILI